MNLNKLTFSQFQQIHKTHYSLDLVYLLLQADLGVSLKTVCQGSVKLRALSQALLRKGLITYEDKVTLAGKELIDFINSETAEEIKKVEINANDFDLWWKTYPGTDAFIHKGKKFGGTRTLRQKKEECRKKFQAIIEEGQYTCTELIAALNYEVLQKKNSSVELGANRMMYMQNSCTYLNQRSFEPFVELIREDGRLEESNNVSEGGTDI